MAVSQAVEILLDTSSSFQQKQSAWARLGAAGKLDEAIKTLEDRATKEPRAPEIPATLGQAYLHKAGSIQDVREQGILGLKADQTFDLALNLDSENWEARFWKATAMSYWPAQLGKGQEVIDHLVELVKQQEARPPQPQYAQVYALLGEQYQKQGYADYATQAWKRGITLFPDDETLSNKLAAAK
jgi:tetratricopeptide (TPR) repeat protein